jgi:hypothetical protein
MKSFFVKLAFLGLLLASGYLGWQNHALRQKLGASRQTVHQLHRELARLDGRERSVAVTGPRGPRADEQRDAVRRRIEQETASLRGLSFREPVKYKLIERARLRDLLVEKLDAQYRPEELARYGRSLAAMGLIPAETDLRETVLALYSEQVAAFYVPEERALYTFTEPLWTDTLDNMMLAHELTHALQDQNFDLTTFPLRLKDDDDRALATAALIEGDATLLMMQWYARQVQPGQMLGELQAMLGQDTAALLAAPVYLREMLLFPYQEGQKFAAALHAHGGAAALNAAFGNPPVSTRQILNPLEYLQGDGKPHPVEMPSLQADGWTQIGDNTLGEFGIRTLLRERVGLFQAQLAARGWMGDRFHVYERSPTGPVGVIWVSRWETEQDAREFEAAYRAVARHDEQSGGWSFHISRQSERVIILRASSPGFIDIARK